MSIQKGGGQLRLRWQSKQEKRHVEKLREARRTVKQDEILEEK